VPEISNEPSKPQGGSTQQDGGRSISRIADVILKLAIGFAAVFAAIIANSYQSKMQALTLLNQREQAESTLRATMFSNLIGPLAQATKDEGIPPEREKLLVELLALNFYDHFEFKPLFEFVYEKTLPRMGVKEAEEAKMSLKSIARRIIDRQVASLIKEGSKNDRTEVRTLTFWEPPQSEEQKKSLEGYMKAGERKFFLDFFTMSSPDGIWKLKITTTECDQKGNVTVLVLGSSNSSTKGQRPDDIKREFYLTPFSFPLTDNTLLADGNRFAFVLDGVRTDENLKIRSVALSLIWFPKSYFTVRERPMNYAEFRSKLGLKPN
jgi:hypothetical protein